MYNSRSDLLPSKLSNVSIKKLRTHICFITLISINIVDPLCMPDLDVLFYKSPWFASKSQERRPSWMPFKSNTICFTSAILIRYKNNKFPILILTRWIVLHRCNGYKLRPAPLSISEIRITILAQSQLKVKFMDEKYTSTTNILVRATMHDS